MAGICKAPGSVNRLTEAIPLKARLTITFRQKQLKKSPPLIFLPALVKIVVVVWRQDQMCKPFDHSSRYFGFFSGIVGFCCFVSVFFLAAGAVQSWGAGLCARVVASIVLFL